MANPSHLRLVFLKVDQGTFNALLSMENPDSGKPLFRPSEIMPDGSAELLSGPMPLQMAAMAPALIDKGEFPYLEGFRVEAFDGEQAIYSQAAGMKVILQPT